MKTNISNGIDTAVDTTKSGGTAIEKWCIVCSNCRAGTLAIGGGTAMVGNMVDKDK